MIPINESFEYICTIMGVTPDGIKSLGNKKKESFTKRIIQVLMRDHYGKNATYEDLAEMMGLNVSSVFTGYDTAKVWLKTGYDEFAIPFHEAEKVFLKWVINYYTTKYQNYNHE